MQNQLIRTELLLGEAAMIRLKKAKVAVFGIGGVGGYAVEALARSGIGAIDLFDNDRVSLSNLNRQIIALHSTIGRYKTDVMKERIQDINPDIKVQAYHTFYQQENADQYELSQYHYILDAVDTVTAKLELAVRAYQKKIPIISCMGAGNKLEPVQLEVADIYETSICPLAKVMRKELKARGVEKLKVVYSKEKSRKFQKEGLLKEMRDSTDRPLIGSIAFVPSAAGLIMAGEVVKELAQGK